MLGVYVLYLEMKYGIGLTCFTPTSFKGKVYKIMIVSCVNIVFLLAIEKMNLKSKTHPQPHITWVDKILHSITQYCLVSI